MKKIAKYDGKEKSYSIKKKLNTNVKIFFLVILGILILSLSIILLKNSISLNESRIVSYNELGNVDYKVYLKENDYYPEKFLPKGMKYVASLINVVNADFKYEMHSTDNLVYEYVYKINARLIITDKNETKVLYDNPYILLKETKKEINSSSFSILEDVDINYDKYNDYVNAFKRDYALSIDSKLIVTMDIAVKGTYTDGKEINSKNQLEIAIPMSEQTIDIKMETGEINNNGNINDYQDMLISNKALFIEALILMLGALSAFGYSLFIGISKNKNKKKDLYTKTINKYLKEYDRIIITSKQPNVDERTYDEIIRVMDISELIDLHDMSSKPIIYYEVIPNEKSYFIIIYEKTLYKLTITRAWLERNDIKIESDKHEKA